MPANLTSKPKKDALAKFADLSLKGKLDLPRYRRVMSYPMWNCFTQAITETELYIRLPGGFPPGW